MPQNTGWTEEQVEYLKALAKEGLSAGCMARMINTKFRILRSRNSVIGKCLRMGLTIGSPSNRRVAAQVSERRRQRQARAKVVRPSKPFHAEGNPAVRAVFASDGYVSRTDEVDLSPVEVRKTIPTLTETCCRWPVGDPSSPDFYFCGREKIPNTPYCAGHVLKAFDRAPPRKRVPDNVVTFPSDLVQATTERAGSPVRSPSQPNKATEEAVG